MAETSISLRGLASQLGLAPSTISVALRPGGRIAEKTRQRVLEAAEALGYRPDPVLSALSRRKHGTVHGLQTVAVLVPAVGSADGIAPATRVHHPSGPSPIDEKMVAAFQYCQQRDAALVDPVPLHYGPTDKLHEDYAPWFERGRPEAVIGPWDGLYRMRVSDLPKNGTPPAYVALRAREDSSVAGFLTAREQVENIALRHLDQLIRHNIKGASDPKTTLVLEPVWKPGRTLPEEAG